MINYHFLIYHAFKDFPALTEIVNTSYRLYKKTSELYFEALFIYYVDDFESHTDGFSKGMIG